MSDLVKTGALYASEVSEWINKDIANPLKNLKLQDGYNVLAELESAVIKINETVGLGRCTKSSVMSALRDMVVQGLSVTKSQCYFIPRGDKLTLMRSYFGTISVLKQAMPHVEVYANLIHKGDEFTLSVDPRGFDFIEGHKTALENRHNEIIAVYCNLVDKTTGEVFYSEVMDWKEVLNCWARSSSKNNSAQKEFAGEMAKRTVINRAVKRFLNTTGSGNSELMSAYQRSLEAEYEDITPPEETAKILNTKSKGKEGLKDLLNKNKKVEASPKEEEEKESLHIVLEEDSVSDENTGGIEEFPEEEVLF